MLPDIGDEIKFKGNVSLQISHHSDTNFMLKIEKKKYDPNDCK